MKLNKLYIFIFFFCAYLLSASSASAETPRITLNYAGQDYPISQTEVTKWQSAQIVHGKKVLKQTAPTVKNSVLAFVGQKTEKPDQARYYNYNLTYIYDYVKTLSEKIDSPTAEPELELKDNVLVKFTPPQDGLYTDIYQTAFDTLTALQVNRQTVDITVYKTSPKKSLAETNDLGINELIAHGVSTFNGSPKNRRHNIAVGVQKFKGLIIKQGETFSFNKYLGPVEAENGFLPELVIKKTGTVPELGGGLCQVSSTTFRAAMEAGLPIVERRNHAYAVQYYAPQGTDATIYPGIVDFKFVNDTPGDILIWPYLKDSNTLIFDFYGTKDARKVTLDKPVQYDRKTDGSMKATWTRHVVTAAGIERKDEFKSVYQPPALFHKTEEFVNNPSSPNPTGLQMPPT